MFLDRFKDGNLKLFLFFNSFFISRTCFNQFLSLLDVAWVNKVFVVVVVYILTSFLFLSPSPSVRGKTPLLVRCSMHDFQIRVSESFFSPRGTRNYHSYSYSRTTFCVKAS